jgi:excisionase family DNA binding protein
MTASATEPDQLFATVTEAAELLRLDERTVRRGITKGEIPAVRVATARRIPLAWLRRAAQVESSDGDDDGGRAA